MLPVCVQAQMLQEGYFPFVVFLFKTHSPSLMAGGKNQSNSHPGIQTISDHDPTHYQVHQK